MQEMNLRSKRHKKKRRRSENGILVGSIILCLVTLTAITITLIMVFRYRAIQMENTVVMMSWSLCGWMRRSLTRRARWTL